MAEHVNPDTPAQLDALNGMRFFAVFHIFLSPSPAG